MGEPKVGSSVGLLFGSTSDGSSSSGDATARRACRRLRQLGKSSGGHELVQVPCAPQGARIAVPFTVSIFNICRAVMWPLSRVLVLMMGRCESARLLCSDSLRAALVPCVQHTARGSFAYGRAGAHGPRTFMVKPACSVAW